MPEVNPYNFIKPIRSRKFFAGREDEMKEICYLLDLARSQSQFVNIALTGKRGIGKTSLTNIISIECRKRGFLVARLDLDETRVKDTIEFYKEFYMAILEAGNRQYNLFGGVSGRGLLASFKRLVEGLQVKVEAPLSLGTVYLSKKLKDTSISDISDASLIADLKRIREECLIAGIPCLCVIVDEANLLQLNKTILQKMRNIFQKLDNYLIILSGTEDLVEELSTVFSPIQRFFFRIVLAPFNFEETEEAIEKPLKAIHSALYRENEFIKDLHAVSGGNPYEVNLIAHFAYKLALESRAKALLLSSACLDEVARQKRKLTDLKRTYESLTLPQREIIKLLAAVGEPASDWDLARREFDLKESLTDEEKIKNRKNEYSRVLKDIERDGVVTSRKVSWKKLYSISDPWFQMYVKYTHSIPTYIGNIEPGIGYTRLSSCTLQIMERLTEWLIREKIKYIQASFRSDYSDDACLWDIGVPYVDGANDMLYGKDAEKPKDLWVECSEISDLEKSAAKYRGVCDELTKLFEKSAYELLFFVNINEFSFKTLIASCMKNDKNAKEVFCRVSDYLARNW